MDGLDGTGLQLDGLDWFKTFIGDQKLKKILYRQLEKVIFPAMTMRPNQISFPSVVFRRGKKVRSVFGVCKANGGEI